MVLDMTAVLLNGESSSSIGISLEREGEGWWLTHNWPIASYFIIV